MKAVFLIENKQHLIIKTYYIIFPGKTMKPLFLENIISQKEKLPGTETKYTVTPILELQSRHIYGHQNYFS